MIPKKIHYCWFGKNPKPPLAEKCIESWKKYCPDYEIIEWNEDNFDIHACRYTKEAYEAKKYAFVSDYVRLYALYSEGGIYMDVDVELLLELDGFLQHQAFSGFEADYSVPTGIMASVSGLDIIRELLLEYADRPFLLEGGVFDLTTNGSRITDTMKKHGLLLNGAPQTVAEMTFYPKAVFCPDLKRLGDKEYMKDTVAIHHFLGSWKSEKAKKRSKSLWFRIVRRPAQLLSRIMTAIFGERWTRFKIKLRKRILGE